ncbi:phospholipase D-like domain-containing protein [Thermoflexibacter ruber]|uniref:hypothetical protein n=1 Tax=Thermoflexibacter ruber TaxID=1003 RepID=UPI001C87A6FC|nr:hypothetical protein [Thermoflexibacter ruber]
MFSDSPIPLIHYRVVENIFCKVFNAENLAREDSAYDAKKGSLGIGIKTFTFESNTKLEKIAEFNRLSAYLRELKGEALLLRLSELRNQRIEFANNNYNIHSAIYHCVSRKENLFRIFEVDYDIIDIEKLSGLKITDKSISFHDGKSEYSFLFSKSTLFRKFHQPLEYIDVPVEIAKEPFEILLQLYETLNLQPKIQRAGIDYVILPLYSLRESKSNNKKVAEKSGLNQWNAGGRKRDLGEVYIPIPQIIHQVCPSFFPPRDKTFLLKIPSGEILTAKLCQENSKALMTNPNNALAEWILRKILKLSEGELLTYERLSFLGVDSMKVSKVTDNEYYIDFAEVDSFEDFLEKI